MAIKRSSKIDMGSSSASMTDMMFLLLIFLMIATTLINSNALKLTLPKSSAPSKDQPSAIVSITPDKKFWLGEKEIAYEDLEAALQRQMEGATNNKILLRADGTAQINEMVMVMNIAIKNEYALNLATDPQ